jgi:hypothetical protein
LTKFRWLAVDKLRQFIRVLTLLKMLIITFSEMVSYIPRLSSLAVSGTPAKAQMSDLLHVLKCVVIPRLPDCYSPIQFTFLRIDQFVDNLRLWNRLLKPGFAKEFSAFIQHYGIKYLAIPVIRILLEKLM